jgi:hypothetical protein
MKRNCKLKFLSIICVTTCILASCNSGIDLGAIDDSSVLFDESLVLPVGEANLTVKEFLSKINIPSKVDTAANEIFFKWDFKDDMVLSTFSLSDSIAPYNKDIVLAKILPSFIGLPLPPNYPFTITIDDNFSLGVNGNINEERIDSVYVNSSLIDVNFNVSPDLASIPPSDFKLQFVFPNNKIVIDNGILPSYSPTQYNKPGQISIGKYKMFFYGMTTLPYQMVITLKTNRTITLTPDSKISVNLKFSNIDYAVAYGFFHFNNGDHKLITIPFKIEDYLPNGSIKFANPIVKMTATTNIGADLDVKADYMSAYNSSDPSKIVWAWFDNHTTKTKLEKLYGPTALGKWTSTTFNQFDSVNGETDQLFDNVPYPNKLDYKFSISSDPLRTQNYLTPDGKVKLAINIQIPLAIKGNSNYGFSDTIPNLNVGTKLENVDSAILVLKLMNGLPLRAKYRMTFWKSELPNDTISAIGNEITKITDATVVGNMFSEYLVSSPLVDNGGTVIEIVPQIVKVMLNKTQIEALKQTRFIIFHVYLDTEKTLVNGVETQNAVHITTNNSFGVKIGVLVKGKFTTTIGPSN